MHTILAGVVFVAMVIAPSVAALTAKLHIQTQQHR